MGHPFGRLCVDCRFFMRHREIVHGPFWSDEKIEVDAIGGDCRRGPPRVTFWGTRFPYVTTGESCGAFERRHPAESGARGSEPPCDEGNPATDDQIPFQIKDVEG